MWNCAKSSTELEIIDKTQIKTYSAEIFELFQNDVSIGLFDDKWGLIYSNCSNIEEAKGYKLQAVDIIRCVSNCENAINQLNTAWRENVLLSFRLICHSSLIYVSLLGDTNYKLVIINKQQENYQEEHEPDYTKLKNICSKFENSIRSLSS